MGVRRHRVQRLQTWDGRRVFLGNYVPYARKFRNGEHNLHCDVVHITTKWVSSLTLDCNGVFAIKAYKSGYAVTNT